jgi:hypothetical protein
MLATIRRIAFLIATSLFATLAVAQTIYTTHGTGTRIGEINASTGAGTDIGATGQSSFALARDLDGTLYTTYDGDSGDAQLATVSPTTGAIVSTIGGLGVSLAALEIDGTGQMWGVGYHDTVLYRINKATAAITAVGATGVDQTMDLSFDPSGNLYSTVDNVLYQLNLSTGASTIVATITGVASSGEGVMGIMHDTDGTLYATEYMAASPLYEINPITGVATVIGNTGFNFPHGGDIYSLPKFTINAAISDAWFFPLTGGQGFLIIVWEDRKEIFLAWFTYDTVRPPEDVTAILGEPGHRWLTGQGFYEGDTALLDVFLASGMVFDSAVPPVESEQLEGATIKIVWIGCNEGLVEYNIPSLGLSGDIPIERIVLDNVPTCEAAQAQ